MTTTEPKIPFYPILDLLVKDYKEVFEGKYRKIIYPYVTYWYYDGELHREDGPAIDWSDGSQFWFKHGKLHRLEGPAVISSIHGTGWYIEGIKYTQEDFKKYLKSKELKDGLDNCLKDKNYHKEQLKI